MRKTSNREFQHSNEAKGILGLMKGNLQKTVVRGLGGQRIQIGEGQEYQGRLFQEKETERIRNMFAHITKRFQQISWNQAVCN